MLWMVFASLSILQLGQQLNLFEQRENGGHMLVYVAHVSENVRHPLLADRFDVRFPALMAKELQLGDEPYTGTISVGDILQLVGVFASKLSTDAIWLLFLWVLTQNLFKFFSRTKSP